VPSIRRSDGAQFPPYASLLATVRVTTVVWVAVTLLMEPTDRATLLSFYRLVRPAEPGWNKIRREAAAGASQDSLPTSLLDWALGCTMVYSALFGTGNLLNGAKAQGTVLLSICALSATALALLIPQLWPASAAPGDVTSLK
jgi:hypothetical protein